MTILDILAAHSANNAALVAELDAATAARAAASRGDYSTMRRWTNAADALHGVRVAADLKAAIDGMFAGLDRDGKMVLLGEFKAASAARGQTDADFPVMQWARRAAC